MCTCIEFESRPFPWCLGKPGSGNAGSNVSFNSKFVQQELQRLDVVMTDLASTKQTLCTLSSADHRDELMRAIQAVSRQLCTSDILANLAETLKAKSRIDEQQDQEHLKRGEKQALVWVAEAEKNWHKTRLDHAVEHRERTKSSMRQPAECVCVCERVHECEFVLKQLSATLKGSLLCGFCR